MGDIVNSGPVFEGAPDANELSDAVAGDEDPLVVPPEAVPRPWRAMLRLPRGASVSLIVRDGSTLVPSDRTVLRHGDELLVVTPRRARDRTESRLRAVSLSGRLAQWLEGA